MADVELSAKDLDAYNDEVGVNLQQAQGSAYA
jgi:hypothetical protein